MKKILNIKTMNGCEKMSKKRLMFVGLGLYDETDISIKGLQEMKQCDKVFAEFYTTKLGQFNKKAFERLIGKKIEVLSREETEKGDKILNAASQNHVVFLTGGDPMIATTHIDLRLRAIKLGITTDIIHSSSISTAIPGILGLQSYKFGRTTTLAFSEKEYFPTSPYFVIYNNKKMGLHTLILLDIQVEKNRYMTANEGFELLFRMDEKERAHLITDETIACVIARAGASDSIVAANTISNLKEKNFGLPLHTLVIPGDLHFMELEALELCAGLPLEIAKKIQKL